MSLLLTQNIIINIALSARMHITPPHYLSKPFYFFAPLSHHDLPCGPAYLFSFILYRPRPTSSAKTRCKIPPYFSSPFRYSPFLHPTITNKNKNPEMAQPCLTPVLIANQFDISSPLTSTPSFICSINMLQDILLITGSNVTSLHFC